MTATVNISTENDADFRHVFSYQTVDGVPIDLTGVTFHMMLRANINDATVSFELTTENGRIVLIDALNGLFELIILQADLEQMASANYQQSLIAESGGAQWRIWRGTFNTAPGPSR
jgi:hypothetical protein